MKSTILLGMGLTFMTYVGFWIGVDSRPPCPECEPCPQAHYIVRYPRDEGLSERELDQRMVDEARQRMEEELKRP